MFGTILLAVDEKGRPSGAIDLLAKLAAGSGDKVVVVHVRPLHNYGRGGVFTLESDEEAQQLVQEQVAKLSAAGVSAVGEAHRALDSYVDRALLDVADQHGAGLIVVGNRGRSDAVALVGGSVSHHVIKHSRVPVMVLREAS
jgi:nucleotide-binding universal stress UspA family protein